VKPLLFVTGHVPAYRVGAFARLHEREQLELALFGGRSQHGGAEVTGELPFPHRLAAPRELARLAAGGRYRAVIAPTGGRAALLATWAGARRGRTPLILWASLWAHPRSAAHALSYLPLRHLYRSADAVVTYGAHVSAYVSARGARNVHVAPQSVDNEFWSSEEIAPPADPRWPASATTTFMLAGRAIPEKGAAVLLDAWQRARLAADGAALVLAGASAGSRPHAGVATAAGGADAGQRSDGVLALDAVTAAELRNMYAATDVLVVPSIRTPMFREPWGLVVNEAMNRGVAVIASDAVGAAAGGLVRDGETGLVVPAGDSAALAAGLRLLATDVPLRERLAGAGRKAVRGFDHDAWAAGFSAALSTLGLSEGVGSVA
jgi:glycosyltransferase involved in cell wall biosynthesis